MSLPFERDVLNASTAKSMLGIPNTALQYFEPLFRIYLPFKGQIYRYAD